MLDNKFLLAATTAFGALVGGIGVAEAGDWTQGYVGIGVGADVVIRDVDIYDPVSNTSNRLNGIGGGDIGASVTVGFDYHLNSLFVAGIFGTYDWSTVKTTAKINALGNQIQGQVLKVDQSWTLGARAGVLLQRDTLFYGLIGYTSMEMNDVRITAPGYIFNVAVPRFNGITFGGGIEHRLTNAISIKAEYRYSNLGSKHLSDNLSNADYQFDPEIHTARLIVAYRLGSFRRDPSSANSDSFSGKNISTWTQGYVGAGLGLDGLTRDVNISVPAISTTGIVEGLGGGNIAGTIVAGYDYQVNDSLVVGIFGNFDFAKGDPKLTLSALGNKASADFLSVDTSWTLGIRGGVLASPGTLLYGLVGFTRTELGDFDVSAPGLAYKVAFPKFNGYTLGAGFEKKLWSHMSIRGEYRYTNLGSKTATDNFSIATYDIDPNIHSARLVAVYRFGGGD